MDQVSKPPIFGTNLRSLNTISDTRGNLTEIFRNEWIEEEPPVQWNYVRSEPYTLRGFHVHRFHTDYLILVEGQMWLGLRDIRRSSPTFDQTSMIKLEGDQPCVFKIPPGVGHGFYFPVKSVLIYSVSHYWNAEDEMGCRYDDVDLGIKWPLENHEPILSPRDQNAMNYWQMVREYEGNLDGL